jgi:pilus assembly protein CpaD
MSTAPLAQGPGRPAGIALRGLALALLLGVQACMPSWGWTPAEAPMEPSVELADLRHAVYFETDKDILTGPELARLDAFLNAAGPLAGRESIRVEGHADERATDLYNIELSARRAERVALWLEGRGVPAASIGTIAYGEAVPAVPGSGPEAWRWNRRAEIVLRRHVVTLPACPDWSKRSGFDPYNQPSSHIGCATRANLARMVADPADLVHGRALGPADGIREADAIRRYREGNIRQLQD